MTRANAISRKPVSCPLQFLTGTKLGKRFFMEMGTRLRVLKFQGILHLL